MAKKRANKTSSPPSSNTPPSEPGEGSGSGSGSGSKSPSASQSKSKSASTSASDSPLREPVEPLDSIQQDAIIAQFQQQQLSMERQWRIILCICAALFTVAMCLIQACQLIRPQSVYIHRVLEGPLGFHVLQFLQTATTFSFLAAGVLAWRRSSQSKWMAAGTTLTAGVMWFIAIWGAHRDGTTDVDWSLLWLPLAPVIFLCVVLYAQYDARVISEEVRKLEKYRYKLTTA